MRTVFEIEQLQWLDVQRIESYQIERGARLCITGASGVGKTTLLEFFNLMRQPQQGTIVYHNRDIRSYEPEHLRREVVMNPQQVVLFGPTVADDLGLYAQLTQQTQPSKMEMQHLIERLQLNCTLETLVTELSGGEKQRVALARTLLSKAPVILLDEPTSALDAQNEQAIIHLLQAPEWREITFIIVSHSQKFVENVATQVIELTKGGSQ